KRNLDRLAHKLETARALLPGPAIEAEESAVGLLAFGSTHAALVEARDQLREAGVATSYCRVRALPVADAVIRFIEDHERVYVVEQNRDAQVFSLLKAVLSPALAERLRSVTHYNGTPISAGDIARPVLAAEARGR
ncbi:MAG: 2-oxoacid:acceptor oxidoreductase subunit alpha, partial [Thermoleophilia bacterium]|nr:2-oxoacid:acceptor oxidoreductase subunit alpha [Thermoleophilia bacterium]